MDILIYADNINSIEAAGEAADFLCSEINSLPKNADNTIKVIDDLYLAPIIVRHCHDNAIPVRVLVPNIFLGATTNFGQQNAKFEYKKLGRNIFKTVGNRYDIPKSKLMENAPIYLDIRITTSATSLDMSREALNLARASYNKENFHLPISIYHSLNQIFLSSFGYAILHNAPALSIPSSFKHNGIVVRGDQSHLQHKETDTFTLDGSLSKAGAFIRNPKADPYEKAKLETMFMHILNNSHQDILKEIADDQAPKNLVEADKIAQIHKTTKGLFNGLDDDSLSGPRTYTIRKRPIKHFLKKYENVTSNFDDVFLKNYASWIPEIKDSSNNGIPSSLFVEAPISEATHYVTYSNPTNATQLKPEDLPKIMIILDR